MKTITLLFLTALAVPSLLHAAPLAEPKAAVCLNNPAIPCDIPGVTAADNIPGVDFGNGGSGGAGSTPPVENPSKPATGSEPPATTPGTGNGAGGSSAAGQPETAPAKSHSTPARSGSGSGSGLESGLGSSSASGATPAATESPPAVNQPSAPAASPPAAAAPATGGSCNGMKNVVFNAPSNPAEILTVFKTLQAAGANMWETFNIAAGADPSIEHFHHRIVMNAGDVQAGVEVLTGPNPPSVLTLFNEPDLSFQGTPTIDPEGAVAALQPILSLTGLKTKLLPPAVAYTEGDWLTKFFAACNGCVSQFDAIGVHYYAQDVNEVIRVVTGVHNAYPDKKIWITETSPGTSPTGMTGEQVIQWMQSLFSWASQTGWVERIYWNEASHASADWGAASPDLSSTDGTLTPLGQAFANLAC